MDKKMFGIIIRYFETNDLTWAYCFSFCTHGAASLAGSNKWLRRLINIFTPHALFNHCLMHRQALVANDIDEDSWWWRICEEKYHRMLFLITLKVA